MGHLQKDMYARQPLGEQEGTGHPSCREHRYPLSIPRCRGPYRMPGNPFFYRRGPGQAYNRWAGRDLSLTERSSRQATAAPDRQGIAFLSMASILRYSMYISGLKIILKPHYNFPTRFTLYYKYFSDQTTSHSMKRTLLVFLMNSNRSSCLRPGANPGAITRPSAVSIIPVPVSLQMDPGHFTLPQSDPDRSSRPDRACPDPGRAEEQAIHSNGRCGHPQNEAGPCRNDTAHARQRRK